MRINLIRNLHPAFPRIDARYYQIFTLSCLLLFAMAVLDLSIDYETVLSILITAQLTQLACTRWFRLPVYEPKAALISSLSLCLLLRTNSLWISALAAGVAISSKFLLRCRGKHIFNPSAFALAVLIFFECGAWISPGQWGHTAFFTLLISCLAGMVLFKARCLGISLSFIGFFSLLLFARAQWLGDPLTIPLHQIQNGALLLFSFFMITDPKTIPDSRAGRLVFAGLVAGAAFYIRFYLYNPNALIYALTLLNPLVILLDRFAPGQRYQWL